MREFFSPNDQGFWSKESSSCLKNCEARLRLGDPLWAPFSKEWKKNTKFCILQLATQRIVWCYTWLNMTALGPKQ